MTESRTKLIEERLGEAFSPTELLIKDQGHLHTGHSGAADGRGHFDVRIVSPAFASKSRLERHRMVYEALGPLLQTDIHALRISAHSPGEL